jgi:hypothetical protein
LRWCCETRRSRGGVFVWALVGSGAATETTTTSQSQVARSTCTTP